MKLLIYLWIYCYDSNYKLAIAISTKMLSIFQLKAKDGTVFGSFHPDLDSQLMFFCKSKIFKAIFVVLNNMSVHQFPSSVTPVCSPPSHLWIASDFLWSVHQGSSVCRAELWEKKVRAPGFTEQNLNESKLRKRTEKCYGKHSGRCQYGLFRVCLCM